MGTSYETDIVTWSEEQAALLREGRLTEIDIANKDTGHPPICTPLSYLLALFPDNHVLYRVELDCIPRAPP